MLIIKANIIPSRFPLLIAFKLINRASCLTNPTYRFVSFRYSRVLRTDVTGRIEDRATENSRDIINRFEMGTREFHQDDGSEYTIGSDVC